MADVADVLEGAEQGARLWVRGLGRAMFPLLRSGDAARVERCTHADVRPGDIAVLRRRSGSLTVHVVVEVDPLRTAPLLGFPDLGGSRVIGRVVGVRRAGLTIPVPRFVRSPLRQTQRVLAWAYGHRVPREATRLVGSALTSRSTANFRRQWLGPFEIRKLNSADVERVHAFASDHLTLSLPFVEKQLRDRWHRTGAAVGAIGSDARLYAFAFLDEYRQEDVPLDGWWIRSVFVAPIARHLGLGTRVVEALAAAAREQRIESVYADVLADNPDSLKLFQALGFSDAGSDLAARVERAIGASSAVRVLSREP